MTCKSSGKVRRFTAGTTARYTLHAINRKLEPGAPPALHVEAVRDSEEPISFSPSVALADYGRAGGYRPSPRRTRPGSVTRRTRKGSGSVFLYFFENSLPSVDLALGKGFAVTVALAVTAIFLCRVSY